jgi:DNA anti-recombination protein RmuC
MEGCFLLYALQAEVQRLTRKVSAAESASTAAAAAASESRQAAAAAEAELQTLRGAAARVESELRAQLADSRAARDAEVAGLASKLERALGACDKAVADAGEMMSGKEGLLAEWKKEAQLVSLMCCWDIMDGWV